MYFFFSVNSHINILLVGDWTHRFRMHFAVDWATVAPNGRKLIFTGRNEVVAKVMFLQVCVCPRGGGCLPQCMLGCHSPPPDQADTLPDQADLPPGARQTPPQDQADTPRDQADTPPGKQTPAYGLRAAGTHPTGMHSCYNMHAQRLCVGLFVGR